MVPAAEAIGDTGPIDSLVHQHSNGVKSLALAATARVSGLISGTLGYIDPACFGGGAPPSSASDLYALGAMLYECLSGELPAETANGAGLDTRVLLGHAPPMSLGARVPGAPRALVTLIDHLLAPDAAARPPRASWVAHHLEQIRRDLEGLGRALPPEDVGPFRGLEPLRGRRPGRLLRPHARDRRGARGPARARARRARRALRAAANRASRARASCPRSPTARSAVARSLGHGDRRAGPRSTRGDRRRARALRAGRARRSLPRRSRSRSPKRASETIAALVLLVDQLEELVTIVVGPSQPRGRSRRCSSGSASSRSRGCAPS